MHTPPSWPGTGREKVCPAPPRKKQPLPRPQKLATCGGEQGKVDWNVGCLFFHKMEWRLPGPISIGWPSLLTKDTCKLFVWESVYKLIYVLFCPTPPCGFSPLPAPPVHPWSRPIQSMQSHYSDHAAHVSPLGKVGRSIWVSGIAFCISSPLVPSFLTVMKTTFPFLVIKPTKNSDMTPCGACNVYLFGFCVIVENINILRSSSSSRRAQIIATKY